MISPFRRGLYQGFSFKSKAERSGSKAFLFPPAREQAESPGQGPGQRDPCLCHPQNPRDTLSLGEQPCFQDGSVGSVLLLAIWHIQKAKANRPWLVSRW